MRLDKYSQELASLAGTIDDICEPLKTNFNIEHFSCHMLFSNKNYISLSNNSSAYTSMLTTDFIHDVPNIILTGFGRTGFYLLHDTIPPLANFESYKNFITTNEFNESLCFIDIVNRTNDPFIVKFTFETKNLCHSVRYNLLNNSDLLKEFCRYFLGRFKQKLAKLPKLTVDKQAFPNYSKAFQQFIVASHRSKDDARNLFSIWLHKHRFLQNKVGKPYLTNREKEILEHTYQNNYTSKELGKVLGIAKRTVDRHFENMRFKLNAIDKPDLINKALAFRLI